MNHSVVILLSLTLKNVMMAIMKNLMVVSNANGNVKRNASLVVGGYVKSVKMATTSKEVYVRAYVETIL